MLTTFTGATVGGLGCGIERTKWSDSSRNHHRESCTIEEYDGLGGRSWFRNTDSATRLSSISLPKVCGIETGPSRRRGRLELRNFMRTFAIDSRILAF